MRFGQLRSLLSFFFFFSFGKSAKHDMYSLTTRPRCLHSSLSPMISLAGWITSLQYSIVLLILPEVKPPGWGGNVHMKRVGMLAFSVRGVNFGFSSHLGCSGKNAIIAVKV